MNDPDLCLEVV